VAFKAIAGLGYGRDICGGQIERTNNLDRVDTLELGWTTTMGEMFQKIEVSDMCTLTSRSVWTGREPPESSDQLIAVFQKALGELDPIDNQHDSKNELGPHS